MKGGTNVIPEPSYTDHQKDCRSQYFSVPRINPLMTLFFRDEDLHGQDVAHDLKPGITDTRMRTWMNVK
jgi:hypothetical protein